MNTIFRYVIYRAAVLFLPLSVLAGCGDDSPGNGDAAVPDAGQPPLDIPLGQALPPLAYVLRPTYTMGSGEQGPETMTGHLYLSVGIDGAVVGTMSGNDSAGASIRRVTGQVDDKEIVLAPGQAYFGGSTWIEWEALRFSLHDADGNGQADSASGSSSGSWNAIMGDVISGAQYTAPLSATLDTTPGTASLQPTSTRQPAQTVLPFEALRIQFQEPVRESELTAKLRVLADGEPVSGTLDTNAVEGIATRATFQPADFLPLDAELTIDLGELTDPSGNALTATGDPASTIADPGSVLDNLGFESDLAGWAQLGTVEVAGTVEGIEPDQGTKQAVVREFATLATYLDVPAADIGALELTITTLTQREDLAGDYTSLVTIHLPGGDSSEVFDAQDELDTLAPCTGCTEPLVHQIGPVTPRIDLTPYRGKRIWLTVESQTYVFIGLAGLITIVDSFRLIADSV